jgi:hypothetical protein
MIHLFCMLFPKNKPHCFNQTWSDGILANCRFFTFNNLESNMIGCFKNSFICLYTLMNLIQMSISIFLYIFSYKLFMNSWKIVLQSGRFHILCSEFCTAKNVFMLFNWNVNNVSKSPL